MKLENKIAVVTGAGSGFGEGIARKFAEEGAYVIVADINENNGLEVVKKISSSGGRAEFVFADVSDGKSFENLILSTTKIFGCLDILVNNAGWAYSNKPSTEVSESDFDKLFNVNVKSIYFGSIHAVKAMKEQGKGGLILNIASTAATRPRPNLTWYNATKGAAVVITKSLAVELASDKIRVCAINPVIGETGLLETFMGMPDTPENREKFLATIPLGRFSKPDDIANAAVFLSSDESNFLTGVCLDVDGGRSI